MLRPRGLSPLEGAVRGVLRFRVERRRLEALRSRQATVAEPFAGVRALFDQLQDRLAEIARSLREGDGAGDAGP